MKRKKTKLNGDDQLVDGISNNLFNSPDKKLCMDAAKIVYNWYETEGALEDFDYLEDFITFVKDDIYDMLDAASNAKEVKIVNKALG